MKTHIFHRYILAAMALSALGAVACGDAKKDAGGSSSVGAGLPPEKPAASYADGDLAVPEDFEPAADEAITRETYRAELDKLAQEIHPPKK